MGASCFMFGMAECYFPPAGRMEAEPAVLCKLIQRRECLFLAACSAYPMVQQGVPRSHAYPLRLELHSASKPAGLAVLQWLKI